MLKKTSNQPLKRLVLTAALSASLVIGDGAQTTPNTATATAATTATVVARIDGQPITSDELNEMTNRVFQAQFAQLLPLMAQLPPEQINHFRQQARVQALQQLITVRLIRQFVDSSNVKATEEEVAAMKSELQEQITNAGLTYEDYLARSGKTDASLTEEIEQALTMEKLLEQRVGPLKPTEEEQKAFYEENIDQMNQPDLIRSSHILIRFPEGTTPDQLTDGQRTALRQRAEQALARAKAGEDFAALARELSEDEGSGPRGGDLNLHMRGDMVPEFDKAEWALEPGQISDIVETQFGYHIIKVTDKRAAGVLAYEDVQPQIEQHLTENKFNEAMTALIEELRGKANIEILQDSLRPPTQAAPAGAIPLGAAE